MTRAGEISQNFLKELELHLNDLKSGKAESTFEISDIAAILHIHPTHLSNTINQELGKSPCDIYEEGLLKVAKELLLSSEDTIAGIARQLTFDPSNFSKFFKHFAGITPKQFRNAHKG